MKPIAIEAIQMTQDSLPTVAATAPIENSTKGGTPLATQNAPVQSMPRSRPALLAAVSTTATSAVELISSPCAARRNNGVTHASHPSGSAQVIKSKIISVVHRRSQRHHPRCHV